ncbi:IS66 family insertion sequence element accessory protein TnpB [Paraburkholderia youngii]|uniref:IS66 family insertion sequence element accessory protein TnpB n=1 Tax=Paraburkholderia youngii TaxID=2782701 RepID=UPI003D19B361
MTRIDEIWLAVDPLDMRAGFDTALARMVKVFGAAHPHHAYFFTNRRANRLASRQCRSVRATTSARRQEQARSGQLATQLPSPPIDGQKR